MPKTLRDIRKRKKNKKKQNKSIKYGVNKASEKHGRKEGGELLYPRDRLSFRKKRAAAQSRQTEQMKAPERNEKEIAENRRSARKE